MATSRYRGFRILTRPYQNFQTKLWTVDFEIRRGSRRKEFSLGERYPTEREADLRCLELGRLTIDGKMGGWSVDSLRPNGFARQFREGAKEGLAGSTRVLLNLSILVVIVIGAIMLIRRAYTSH